MPRAGFSDDRSPSRQISLASGWTRRRTPSLLDIGQTRIVMWDGRHDALFNQVFGPFENPAEMNSSRLYVAQQIAQRYRIEYEAVFGPMPDLRAARPLAATETGCNEPAARETPACHGVPGDRAEYDALDAAAQRDVTRVVANVGKAVGAYERLLTCGPSRFDAWMHGRSDALNTAEQRGARLFVGRGGCVTCHAGPYLSDQRFHNVGLAPRTVAGFFVDSDDPGASAGLTAALADTLNSRGAFSDGDDGRLPASVPASALGAFRTPMLRCVSQRPSFMHTAQFTTLEQVVGFFARGGDSIPVYPGANELRPVALSEQDRADLVAFLRALDGPGPDAALLTAP